ncbi:MAG: hypothetical protein OK454_10790, partial [Thaumarchaeota archaeon]|nr:hypothetical protein [Nitrososphaerota archaeon]
RWCCGRPGTRKWCSSGFETGTRVKALGVRKATTSSYHPQSNGMAENSVKLSKAVLAKLVSEYGGDWDEHLPQVEVRLVSRERSPAELSPYKATTGRDLQLPSAFENPLHVTQSADVQKMIEVDKVIKDARDDAAKDTRRGMTRTARMSVLRSGTRCGGGPMSQPVSSRGGRGPTRLRR